MSKAQGQLLHIGENKGMMSPGCKLGEHCPLSRDLPLVGDRGASRSKSPHSGLIILLHLAPNHHQLEVTK